MTTINRDFIGCFGKPKGKIAPSAIVIHHTCTSSPARTRSSLKRKNYSTHFEIDKDGTIYQYRELDEMCMHCGSSNFTAIGIDLTHLADAKWPAAQIEACEWLVGYICEKTGIPQIVHTKLTGIYPHKALCQTACPQDFPMAKLGELDNE